MQTDAISASAKLFTRAIDLKKYFVGKSHEIKIETYGRQLINSLIGDVDQEYLVASNSLLVSSWGCFEEYIRKVLPNLAKEINDLGVPKEDVPEKLLTENVKMTSDALKELIGGSSLFSFKISEMTEDFAENYRSSGKLRINHQAIGMIGGKFSLEDISIYLKRLCFEIKWDEIGKSQDLQKFFGRSIKSATGVEAKHLLEKIIKWRNQIAHNGMGNTLVTDRPILELLDYLWFFACRLDELLADHIKQLCKRVS